jgi:serine/threonine protein kinase
VQRVLRLCGNTIKLLKIYESDKYLNLLMEYQEGGTLGDILARQILMGEEDVRMIIAQILLTVDFMHRKRIIHRDLKPENVLMNSKTRGVFDVRIADFGFAVNFDDFQTDDFAKDLVCGTPGYIAPEILSGTGATMVSDIFSVGSILFSVLTSKNLFSAATPQKVIDKNRECNLEHVSQHLLRFSKEARTFTKSLLNKDPLKRPSAAQALQHDWFKKEKSPLVGSIMINEILADNNKSPRHMLVELQMMTEQISQGYQSMNPAASGKQKSELMAAWRQSAFSGKREAEGGSSGGASENQYLFQNGAFDRKNLN